MNDLSMTIDNGWSGLEYISCCRLPVAEGPYQSSIIKLIIRPSIIERHGSSMRES